PRADLAPRDVVSRDMSAEIEKSSDGQVFLDISHLPADTVQSRFPTIYNFCMGHGLDITKGPVPIAPAAHYMMGGVETDTWGRTNLGGLYACGEVACAAVHGANRLASNSLLDTLVFAQRVVASTLDQAQPSQGERYRFVTVTLRSREPGGDGISPLTLPALQDLMWRDVGITRRGDRLLEAARTLAKEPLTIQLRYLSTLSEIGMEQNSIIVFPLPIDLISGLLGGSQPAKKES
ncbi:MAG: FAD-binding protein, partial [Acidobacteria bacterium]|nr:FAD-binding protein [Acidobacteriota bacterium]